MQFILSILLVMLTACSGGNSKNVVEDKVPAANNLREMTDEDKFIYDEPFRSAMLKSCLSTQTFKRRTMLGKWYTLKNCNIRFNDINIQNLDIAIHKDDEGRVNGLEFMIYPSTDYGLFLQERQLEHAVSKISNTCSRYYWNTLPIFTLVEESLCDYLRYDHL